MDTDGERIIEAVLGLGADYCDVRSADKDGVSIEVKNGRLVKSVPGRESGFSVRVLLDGAWGFYSTNREQRPADVAEKVVATARAGRGEEVTTIAEAPIVTGEMVLPVVKDPRDIAVEDKHAVIVELEKAIREVPSVMTVTTGYEDAVVRTRIVTSEGTDVTSEVTRLVAQANLISKKEGAIMGYRVRVGGTQGFELLDSDELMEKGREAAASADRILTADHSPSGRMPVVADPDLAGVFIHEALGHASEADLVTSRDSILEGRIGEMIASEIVTVYDDPTMPGAFGSFPYDDEGIPAQNKTLIEKGKLTAFLQSRETASKLDMPVNGSARAESYASRPLVRMSNTMIGAGDMTMDEIFEGIGEGIYAKGTRGGQVDTAKGTFQFSAQEAYLIVDGEIDRPLKDVSLSGGILTAMMNIDGLTKESELGSPGFCGKGAPQLVPVGDGGPYTRFKEILVGGQ